MVIPAQAGGFDFTAMAQSLQSNYPTVKHIFVFGGERRPGMTKLGVS
jgi:hypothetical protein